MTLNFTPYTYLFLAIYSLFLISLFSLSSFYLFWLFIELMTLLLMGLSYTLFTNSVSFLMIYFLVQSLSSFLILISFIVDSFFLLTFSVFLKLGMFPFYSWYFNSVSRFPNFIFWLTGTFHNLPVLFMLSLFHLSLSSSVFWLSVVITTFVASSFMFYTSDFRWLLVASSVGNNSWFLLSQQSSFLILISFIVVYSLFFGLLLNSFNLSSKPIYYGSYTWMFYLLCISGLPPFPVFFLNLGVVYTLFSYNFDSLINCYMVAFFLVFNAIMVVSYVQFLINHQIQVFSSFVNSQY